MRIKVPVIFVVIAVVLASAGNAEAQCGPGCPACSGKFIGDLIPPKTLYFSGMYIPQGEEERAVFNLRYGLFSWLDAGIGYAVAAEDGEDEIIWSLRVEPISQDPEGWRPGLIIGTGSVDRTAVGIRRGGVAAVIISDGIDRRAGVSLAM